MAFASGWELCDFCAAAKDIQRCGAICQIQRESKGKLANVFFSVFRNSVGSRLLHGELQPCSRDSTEPSNKFWAEPQVHPRVMSLQNCGNKISIFALEHPRLECLNEGHVELVLQPKGFLGPCFVFNFDRSLLPLLVETKQGF